ncbi:MAG: hypothetical protein LBS81_01035 [Endomicrobium sp.]|jgi:hypothetical protein|nr:hypothetical protein [Endomicrobium sp.]
MLTQGKVVYVRVVLKNINMFDGSGFISPKDGEEVYLKVPVSESDSLNSKDLQIFKDFKQYILQSEDVMISGVISNGIDGKMAMMLNENRRCKRRLCYRQ